jgi:hypothetical protein
MIDDITFLDDSTRPRGPRFRDLTREQRAAGEHLKDIHDHLRDNMGTLRELIAQGEAGTLQQAELDKATDELAMVRNFRRFGTLCGQYCQFVHGHHSIEDSALFPALAAKSEALRKVTERLKAEHEVVHALLIRLIGALNGLLEAPSPETFADARTVYEALERVLLSHLGYEEDEIGDALGVYGVF